MVLEKLSKTVDFVQATTPSNANDGETYLDTSQSPPQLKVFDSSANAFVRPRSVQNLDAPVSGAGATQTDIETAVDNSNTASTVSNNLDAKVSNAGKGVDWESKTPDFVPPTEFLVESGVNISNTKQVTKSINLISGSGYLTEDENKGVSVRLVENSGNFFSLDKVSVNLSIDNQQLSSKNVVVKNRQISGNSTESYSSSNALIPIPMAYFSSDLSIDVEVNLAADSTDLDIFASLDDEINGVLLD